VICCASALVAACWAEVAGGDDNDDCLVDGLALGINDVTNDGSGNGLSGGGGS